MNKINKNQYIIFIKKELKDKLRELVIPYTHSSIKYKIEKNIKVN